MITIDDPERYSIAQDPDTGRVLLAFHDGRQGVSIALDPFLAGRISAELGMEVNRARRQARMAGPSFAARPTPHPAFLAPPR